MKSGNDTLGSDSRGFGSGFKDGGGMRGLNDESDRMGNPFAANQRGGLLGGLFGGGLMGWGGYQNAQGRNVGALMDTINGGGRGRAGQTFEGGLLSSVANRLGVRPAGYRERLAAEASGQGSMAAQPAPMAPTRSAMTPNASTFSTPPVQQPVAQTMPPTLTAQDIERLRAMGIDVSAMVGEPASLAEMLALIRGPGMLPGGTAPSASYATPQAPTLYGGQGYAPRPLVDMGRPDMGTMRPFVSRVQPPMGLLGR